MAYQMAAQRKRLTVLGSVKAPKPVNLPSQKRENNGMDPTISLVPSKAASGSGSVWGNPAAAEGPPAPPTPHIPPPRPVTHAGPAWNGLGLPDARKEASASMADDYPTLAVAPEVSQTVPEQAPVVLRAEERSQSGREVGPQRPMSGRPYEPNGTMEFRAPHEGPSGDYRPSPDTWVPPGVSARQPPQEGEFAPGRHAGPRGGHQQGPQPYYNGPNQYRQPQHHGPPHNIPAGPGMHAEYHNGPHAGYGRGPRPEYYPHPDARIPAQRPPPHQQHHLEREGDRGEGGRQDGARDFRQTWHPPHPSSHHPPPNFPGGPPPGAHQLPPPGGQQPQMVLPPPPVALSPRADDAQMKVLRREPHEGGDPRLHYTGMEGVERQVPRGAPMPGGLHPRAPMPGGPHPGMPHPAQRPAYGPGPGVGFLHARPHGAMPPPHHMQMHGMGMGYGVPYMVQGNPNIPPPPPPPPPLAVQPPMQGVPPMQGPPQPPPMLAHPPAGPFQAPPQAGPPQLPQPSSPMLFGSLPADLRSGHVVLNQASAVMFGGEAGGEASETSVVLPTPASASPRQPERGPPRLPHVEASMPKVVPSGTPTVSEIEEQQIAQQRVLQEAVLSQPQSNKAAEGVRKQGEGQQQGRARPREHSVSGPSSTAPQHGGISSQGQSPMPSGQREQRRDKERPPATGPGAPERGGVASQGQPPMLSGQKDQQRDRERPPAPGLAAPREQQDFLQRRPQERREREGKRRENREGPKGGPKNGLVNGVQAADGPNNGEIQARDPRANHRAGGASHGPHDYTQQQPRPQAGSSAPASPRLAEGDQRAAREPRRPSEGYKRDKPPRAVPMESRRAVPISAGISTNAQIGPMAGAQGQEVSRDRSTIAPGGPKAGAQEAGVTRDRSLTSPAPPKGGAQGAEIRRERSGDGSEADKERKGKKVKQHREKKEKVPQGAGDRAPSTGGRVEGTPSMAKEEGQGLKAPTPGGFRNGEQANPAPQEVRLVKDALKAAVPEKPERPRPAELPPQQVNSGDAGPLWDQDRPRERSAPPPGLNGVSHEAPRSQQARRERGGKKKREKRERQVAAAAGDEAGSGPVPPLPPGLSSSSKGTEQPNAQGSVDESSKKPSLPPGLVPQRENGVEQKPEQKLRAPRSDRANRPPRDIYHPPGAAGQPQDKSGGSVNTGNGPNAPLNEGKGGDRRRPREKRAGEKRAGDGGGGRGNAPAGGGTENGDERRVREGMPRHAGEGRPAAGDGHQGNDKTQHKSARRPKPPVGGNTDGGANHKDRPAGESDASKQDQPKRANNPKEAHRRGNNGGSRDASRPASAAAPRAVPAPAAVHAT